MTTHKIFALILLLIAVKTITITVSSARERCMIVTSNDQRHLLKVDVKFPRFEAQTNEEGYRVVLLNTQTHEEQAFQVIEGTFRKQFNLTENVVYRFCFKIVHNRYSGKQITQVIQYSAGIKHTTNSDFAPNITVPDSLLKVKDLQNTYKTLVNTQNYFKQINSYSKKIQIKDAQTFVQQKEKVKTLEWISLIEIIVICVFGAYQYYKLKELIQKRQSH